MCGSVCEPYCCSAQHSSGVLTLRFSRSEAPQHYRFSGVVYICLPLGVTRSMRHAGTRLTQRMPAGDADE